MLDKPGGFKDVNRLTGLIGRLEMTAHEPDDLPEGLEELAAQLSADADRLADLYPPQALADEGLAAVAGIAAERRGKRASHLITGARVAAAVLILGGLTIAISSPLWRPGLTSSGGDPIVNSGATPAGGGPVVIGSPAVGAAAAAQPVFISTETLRHLSGEKIEILADALEAQIADI